jgi:hypothetical protein
VALIAYVLELCMHHSARSDYLKSALLS